MKFKRRAAYLSMLFLLGCGGTGIDKRAPKTPDEEIVVIDMDDETSDAEEPSDSSTDPIVDSGDPDGEPDQEPDEEPDQEPDEEPDQEPDEEPDQEPDEEPDQAVCGDGVVEESEVCDDGSANGYYGYCNSDCTGLGEHCGDGVLNGDEECDGDDLAQASCQSQRAGRGTVSCAADCSIDTSMCSLAPGAGELVVTEIMQNPDANYDHDGEWFELFNVSARTVDLEGCTVESGTASGPETFQISRSLTAGSGDYITLARSTNAPFVADYVYGSAMNLNNSVDYVALFCPDPFDPALSILVDRVDYDDGATFPDPVGASMNLAPHATDADLNDDGHNWCEASSPFGLGDLGTPGAPNDPCD